MTRAPSFSNCARSSADCDAVRVVRMVLPVSSIPGDFGKNFSGSHGKQSLAKLESPLAGTLGGSGQFIFNNSTPIQTRDQTLDGEPNSHESSPSGDRHLAASTKGTK